MPTAARGWYTHVMRSLYNAIAGQGIERLAGSVNLPKTASPAGFSRARPAV